jgi:uncharacterized membrane protein YdbT with pleckstrin-like domain
MTTAAEETVWSGTPSQVINLPAFIGWGLLFWLIIPLFIIAWRWLVVKNTQYELTTQRLRTRSGVINKKTDDLELYRVKDYRLDQPFALRIFSLGNVVLETSDKSHPIVVVQAIRNAEQLKEKLRTQVEALRDKKRVRELDFE